MNEQTGQIHLCIPFANPVKQWNIFFFAEKFSSTKKVNYSNNLQQTYQIGDSSSNKITIQGTSISHLVKRKIIHSKVFWEGKKWTVPRRVFIGFFLQLQPRLIWDANQHGPCFPLQLIGPHLASRRSHSSSVPNVNLWPDPAFAYLKPWRLKRPRRRRHVLLENEHFILDPISVVAKDQSDDSLICTLFSLSLSTWSMAAQWFPLW